MNPLSVLGAVVLVALMCALGLSGCTPDAAAFISAAGTRGACIVFVGPGYSMQAETVNQNSTTVDSGCKLAQGINMAPTNVTVNAGGVLNMGK